MSEISRRRVLQGSGVATAGLALASCTGSSSTPPSRSTSTPSSSYPSKPSGRSGQPNIVLIVADDIGYTDLGCFGGEIPTPNLDRLAAGGRRFTQMLTNPMCCPSRASLLTGLYPTQAGVGYYTRDYGSPGYVGHLNDNCVTIAQVLKAAGYQTAISGKWHVSGWHTPPAEPPARGFDQSFCEIGGNGYFTTKRFLNGMDIGVSPKPDFYMTNAITEFARQQITAFAKSPDPFFVYTAYTAPHFPLQAPADDIAPFHGTYRQGWDAVRAARYERAGRLGIIDPAWRLAPRADGVAPWADTRGKDWQAARMEVYAAQVHVMDRGIGQILDTLEQLEILDETVVLFLGDNGASAEVILPGSRHGAAPTRNGRPMRAGNDPSIFPGGSDTFCSYGKPWGSASATPFRRYKLWVEEGGLCTPFIASWPGTLDAGGIDARPLHLMDVMPTFVDLAGAHYPATYQGRPVHPMQGESFAPALSEASGAHPGNRDRWLFWEFAGHRAARHGRYKIVSDEPSGPWQLYDMVDDRTETFDLAAQHTDVVSEMDGAWQAWKQRVGVVPWDPRTGYRRQ
ncbi:MAG: arylsulfatase [Actinomycetota bacterium]|nr:arylsulfatase [Actinomycetota bacterium]